MATILMTGGTGTVGSYLAPVLKKAGHAIVFILRAETAEEARNRVLAFMELDRDDICLVGDVTRPNCGLESEGELSRLHGGIDKVLHCAASIKFDPNLSDEIEATNIKGTENILNLASRLNVPEFHHVSTLFIAGDADSFLEGDFDMGQSFRNTYERSKFEAERLVRSRDGRYSIYRLGIVVGDSEHGRTPSFTGFYGAVLGFWELYNSLLSWWREGKITYKEQGVFFDDQDNCHLPMRLVIPPSAHMSLTPIDWTVSRIAGFLEEKATNRVHHISHFNPPRTRWITETTLDALKFKDVILTEEEFEPRNDFIGKLEKKIRRSINAYRPYIMNEAEFHPGSERGARCDFSKDLLLRLLAYAKSRHFGRKSTC